ADVLEKEDDPLQDPTVQGLLARLEDFELGLELCLAEGSPLPPLAKDVVRGFFISVLPPPEKEWCGTCGGEGVIDGEVCPHCDCGEG
ncbi:MAG: hypothetical protein GWO24_25915, partial [Akkermansiaceae bacterium]|nr:hypothetical protein [Akkermansiaceae bacterium]